MDSKKTCLNRFAPTRTLLHTYNRHDNHHHHDHHHHHHNHHLYLREGSNFATPYEQYVDWGNNINFIFLATWSQTRSNVRVAANMFSAPHLSHHRMCHLYYLHKLKWPGECRWGQSSHEFYGEQLSRGQWWWICDIRFTWVGVWIRQDFHLAQHRPERSVSLYPLVN